MSPGICGYFSRNLRSSALTRSRLRCASCRSSQKHDLYSRWLRPVLPRWSTMPSAPLLDLLHNFEEHRLVLLHAAGLEPEPALELALQLAHAQRLVVGLLVEHELHLRLDLRARRHRKIARSPW